MVYKYDIAISYQSELEEKASKIADFLQAEQLNVFFAPMKQREMYSEKLHQVLYDVYKNQSFIKVLLVTKEYLEGEWTSLEMRMSMKSTEGERKRLLIINYMGNNLPEELKVFVYLDGQKLHEDEIASVIAQRISDLKNNEERANEKESKENKENKEKSRESVQINNYGGITTGNGATISGVYINN